jgi:capsular exopolysaccharide synthesis family protein
MNRIQQILSKAERDGTARRLESVDHPVTHEPAQPSTGGVGVLNAPMPITRVVNRQAHAEPAMPPAPPAPHEDLGAVGYVEAPTTAHLESDAKLAPMLVAGLDPLSAAADPYRSLRSRIAQADNGSGLRVIQISSPGRHDGKTITALNLALTMAQEFQRRVLMLDADLRQPRVHALLGLEPGPGLVDVLTGTATLDQALIEIPDHHLTVLRAGAAYGRPAEMLGSGPMRRLIDSLRTQFDRIVVDSSCADVADPGAIAPLVDGMLLVVRASVTTKPAIARAVNALASSKLLGLVFNESEAPLQTDTA